MFGPGVWVVTGEIFPLKVRAKCLEFDDCSQLALQLAAPFITPRLEGDYANLGFNVDLGRLLLDCGRLRLLHGNRPTSPV